jgi:DNA uptake protein ComE-like DNA-binding protein
VEKILKVKGVPKKLLDKLVAERPFRSEKAVLNVKGMGPAMLNKIIAELTS